MIREKLYKFFSWVKDHLHLLLVVILRLRIGESKKENPNDEVADEDATERK